MANALNISSEEELLQLRDEGKISEVEYQDLLDAMRKSMQSEPEEPASQSVEAGSKRKVGKISFYLMLAGFVLPVVCILLLFVVGWFPGLYFLGLWFFLGVVMEIAALGTGIAAWADPFGKAAVIASSLILIAVLLFVIGFMPRRVSIREERRQLTHLEATELKSFPLDNTEGLITQTGVQIDKQISSDGNGSLRIEATEPRTVRLFETGDIDIENARLIYQARLRTENVEGRVYLEMWCHFVEWGDSFSRGLMVPLTGTTEWTTEEIPFLLKKGENPDNVKLNLGITGTGTVWIDDIRLLKGPLKY